MGKTIGMDLPKSHLNVFRLKIPLQSGSKTLLRDFGR
jgi:hypothetical protein